MPQFSLGSSNGHWGYGAAGAYSTYLGGCAAPGATAAPQFNAPALGFSTSDQTSAEQAFSRKYARFLFMQK